MLNAWVLQSAISNQQSAIDNQQIRNQQSKISNLWPRPN